MPGNALRSLTQLYLGGGSDTRTDNRLLFFKSADSPERLAYRTGRRIFDRAAYDELARLFPRGPGGASGTADFLTRGLEATMAWNPVWENVYQAGPSGKALERHSIEARPVWKPMHLQPLFAGAPYFSHAVGEDVAAMLFDAGICLPSGSNLSDLQISQVIGHLRSALLQAEDVRAAD